MPAPIRKLCDRDVNSPGHPANHGRVFHLKSTFPDRATQAPPPSVSDSRIHFSRYLRIEHNTSLSGKTRNHVCLCNLHQHLCLCNLHQHVCLCNLHQDVYSCIYIKLCVCNISPISSRSVFVSVSIIPRKKLKLCFIKISKASSPLKN